MLPLVDADREEARYQKLAESFKSEARALASSRSRAYDFAPSFRRAPSQVQLEGTAIGSALEKDALDENVPAVVESLCPLDQAGRDALDGKESSARPPSMVSASIPGHDTCALTPIIESDGLTAPSSETVPLEACPPTLLGASYIEGSLIRSPPSAIIRDSARTTAFQNSFDPVRRNSDPISHASSLSRPSSPVLSGSEGPGVSRKRGHRARRARASKTRSSSRSRTSTTPSRRGTGDNNDILDSVGSPVQCLPAIDTLPAPPAYEHSCAQARPPPSSFVERGRSPASALLDAPASASSQPNSISPSRDSSPTPSGTARANQYAGSGLSRPVSNISDISYGTYGAPDSGLHLPVDGPRTHPAGRGALSRFGPYHTNQSHPSIYRDLPTAIGLSPAPQFQSTLLNHPPIPTSDNPYSTLNPDMELRQRPRPYESAQDVREPELREMEEGLGTRHDKAASGTLCNPHDSGDTTGDDASPPFPLKVFRRRDFKVLEIKGDWDDEKLLTALKKTYDQLRGWRKYFGLMDIAYLTPVLAESFIYPQRVGTPWISSHKNMRMCYLLQNPAYLRGERQVMAALTQRIDLGVEFVERWKTRRLLGVAGLCAILAYLTMVVWGVQTGDWATASQIGQFHLAMFSLLFIAVAWSQNHDF